MPLKTATVTSAGCCGDGRAACVGEALVVGETEALGLGLTPPAVAPTVDTPWPNPFTRMATPTTTRPTMTMMRADPKFTGPILPQPPRLALTGAEGQDRHAEPGRHAPASTRLTHPTEASHEHGVVHQRLGPVDEPVEQLVVASRREAEMLADRALLGHRQLPALTLESEDLPFTITQLGGG